MTTSDRQGPKKLDLLSVEIFLNNLHFMWASIMLINSHKLPSSSLQC